LLSENFEIKNREPRVLFQGRFVSETSFIPTFFSECSTIFIEIMQFQMGNSSPDQQKEGTFPRWKKRDFWEIFTTGRNVYSQWKAGQNICGFPLIMCTEVLSFIIVNSTFLHFRSKHTRNGNMKKMCKNAKSEMELTSCPGFFEKEEDNYENLFYSLVFGDNVSDMVKVAKVKSKR
jgi:hypothetical protein